MASERRVGWTLLFVLLVVAASLAACGRGADGPTAPLALDPAGVEAQSYRLVNEARSQQAIAALELDAELSSIARDHSRAMRDQGFFGHLDSAGAGLRERLKARGVTFSAAGENLALVEKTTDPAGLAHGHLLASPEHREVMLAGRFTQVGVGVARSGDRYWITQIYLRP